MAKIVGRAVALARGYYPDDGEHNRIIEEGEEFNLVEGMTKGRWFDVLSLDEEQAPKAEAKAEVKAEGKPAKTKAAKAAQSSVDDIA